MISIYRASVGKLYPGWDGKWDKMAVGFVTYGNKQTPVASGKAVRSDMMI